MIRRTIQLAKTDPRASHLAISQGVGSIHAPFSRFSLYDSDPGLHARQHIYTLYIHEGKEGGRERGEKCAHATHFQVGTIESLDLTTVNRNYHRWKRKTKGLRGRNGWDWGDTSNREKLSRIARTLERLISEYRRGEDGDRASKVGIRSEFDKNSLDFSRHRRSRGSNAVSVNFSRPRSLKYERRESARRYGTYGETLNGT